MSSSTPQVDALREARRRDSLTKRARVLQALAELEQRGEAVTFAAVARHARVSTWLVYADGVREHIDTARARQAAQPVTDRRAGRSPSPAGLRTDLELARVEITALRTERDQLRDGMRHQLGRDLDTLTATGMATRIEELTRRNQQLSEQNHQLDADNTTLRRRVTDLEADLAAARTGLRRMIREQNSPDRATDPRPHG